PVPEPGAASLIGGGALLLLALRNKFRRPHS
ncbi:MAG: PEP-CTERM sorting domain-containing protein, partial [Verrucomicrobiota bacterium]